MHPAPSVIFFTTFSGLGFGLLVWLGLGYPAVTGWTAFVFFAIAYAMAVGGLLASTFHLGRPERAIKAFTQWRSSWLSREAWCAVGALVLMGLYAAGLVFADTRIALLGILGALFSLATVFTTSMIYTQLKTIPRWNMSITPVKFLVLSLAGGALLSGQVQAALILLVVAGVVQGLTWIMGDRALEASGTSLKTATGLGEAGSVRSFEPPHTGTNYLLREFVHEIGRKHSQKLRLISLVLMVGVPFLLLILPFNHFFALLAVISHVAGVLTARWLFFAEAEHVVGLYYGKR
ncbi:dimethyl sulfoxide reductase anchor subunit family protein [Roseobacter ponti]|uniref:Dimethyl sulfoxide reductase anchor subunit n=1 Tax=Roseobacter ponti TaxID=1891787 RepID=A0A858SY48_9RHOB|nr:DmsC/YnfH family molybdoenzyme membrane anchor subunit [Roseobacter ponti]QJF52782.1 dimethyl sulfoxide reductase anchor subunit [Roseobacter ponti]